MNRELAKELKAASFPMLPYRAGHKFYPPEHGGVWSDASRRHGVTLIHSDLEDRLQDIKDGYYCSNLSDLIEACGQSFSRLSVVKTVWTAESVDGERAAMGGSPEEAVARLWLTLNRPKLEEMRTATQRG
jgi:hypothetical protein